jgi:hypothetical protein
VGRKVVHIGELQHQESIVRSLLQQNQPPHPYVLRPIFLGLFLSIGLKPYQSHQSIFDLWIDLQAKIGAVGLDCMKVVRVRWVDHKCKVNSDEFDEEERYLQAR